MSADIRIWDDPWLPELTTFKMDTRVHGVFGSCHHVQVLVEPESGRWDVVLVRNLFAPVLAEAILKLKAPAESKQDELIWVHEKSEKFSVRSMYRELVRLGL